jgi:hypothetical protein
MVEATELESPQLKDSIERVIRDQQDIEDSFISQISRGAEVEHTLQPLDAPHEFVATTSTR